MNHDAFNPSEDKVEYIKNWQDVPVGFAQLPTKGKLYPEDHPLYGQEEVEVKALTSTEEDILSSVVLAKKGTMMDELIKSCLVNKSIDPTTLFVGDKNSILFRIRATGFGPEYKVNLTCTNCKAVFPNVFMLDKIEIRELPENSGQVNEGQNLFRFELPLSKSEVQFKILVDKDFKEISQAQEQRKKAMAKRGVLMTKETKMSDSLLKSIVSIDGEKDRGEVSKMFKRMLIGDSQALRVHIAKIQPDLNLKKEVFCPSCGHLDEYVIPMTSEFFWPQLD